MKRLFFTLISIFGIGTLLAQELNVNVTVNTPKLQTADPALFESLETAINEFYANMKWTEDNYETEERINVNINITISEEKSVRDFGGEMTIQATRPVFGSEYEAVILNHVDKDFNFTYEQFQPVQYTSNSFNDNLTSMLAFYAYVILGLDGDTFSALGGEKHFQSAQEIVNLVPQATASSVKGWRSVDNPRNRYWMVENLLTPRIQPMRQALYDYHRLGLDQMAKEPDVARVFIIDAMEKIAKVDRNYPNSMIVQMFAVSKSSEIISIFMQGTPEQKKKAADIMIRFDASNARKFNVLKR